MSYKRPVLHTLAIIQFIIGSAGSYIFSAFVFDRSYMMTLGALGEPGAEAKMWSYFTVTILFAVTGIAIFILSFKRKRDQKPNISDSLN
jgi:hypothetical protein